MSTRRSKDVPWRLVLVLWGYRLFAAALIAHPVVKVFGATGLTSHPEGDAIVFRSGASYLIEALRLGAPALGAALEAAAVTAILFSALGLLPLAAIMASLAGRARGGRACLNEAATLLPPFTLLAGATLLVQLFVGLAFFAVLARLIDPLRLALGDRTGDLVLLSLGVLGGSALLVLGVLQDLARGVLIAGERVSAAVRKAVSTLVARPFRVLTLWAALALTSGIVIGGAAMATEVLDVSNPAVGRLLGVLLVHQAAALTSAALKVLWLARAIGFVTARQA